MEYSNDAIMKIGKFSGEGTITYQDKDGRFTIRKKPSSTGAGIVVGVMFGALGQAVMNSVSTGEELASFTSEDITLVTTVEKRKRTVFTLYPADGSAAYEINIEIKREMHGILRRVLADKMEGAAPKRTEREIPAVPVLLPEESPVVIPEAPVWLPEESPVVIPEVPAWIPEEPPVVIPEPPAWTAEEVIVPEIPPVQIPVEPPVQVYTPAPAPRQTNALFCLRTGPMAGLVYDYPAGSDIVIGRDPSRCTLVLSRYPNVSGVHCRAEIGDHCLRITDLNSTNGTFVNGERLPQGQSAMLREGDVLKLANDVCLFQIAFE